MDDTRFDNLTRLFGSGLNRRKVLRGLLGGAGALAATGVTRQFASAQLCQVREDCVNVQQNDCAICPTGSQPGNDRALTGTCCTDNGTCCSNICNDGMCVDFIPPECEVNGDCGGCSACVEGECVALACCADTDCSACQECEGNQCVDLNNCCENDADCGACQECEGGVCVDLSNCCQADGDCTEPCHSCLNGTCTPFAEYCPEGDYCYNTGTGECCYDNECGNQYCVDGQCQACRNDSDCGSCAFCDQGVCYGACSQSEECCEGECVELGDCCRGTHEPCGLLDVTAADGSLQLDCCDGLVCCENWNAQHPVCAQCCNDWDCPKGAFCHEGWCEYPDYCDHDKDCPKGTCCCHDGSCSAKCCYQPPKPPKPHKPAPEVPVTKLPATGAAPDDERNGLLGAAALGAAAAVLAAKKMRETPGEAASQE